MFTRLDPHDPHWRNPRKTLARAFSADEIRCAASCSMRSAARPLPALMAFQMLARPSALRDLVRCQLLHV